MNVLKHLLWTYFPRVAAAIKARIVILRKAVNFGLIGVVNTVVDFGIYTFGIKVLGLPLIPANILSWLIAITGSYVMNSFITFAAESGRKLTWRDYMTFLASGIVGLLANTATLVIAAALLGPYVPEAKLVAKIPAILVSFIVNFSMSHFVVFRPRRRPASEPR